MVLSLALACLLATSGPPAGDEVVFHFRLVAMRGAPAPGAPAPLVFEHFGHLPSLGGSLGAPPAIDASGSVGFHAFLGDGDTATLELAERGVWREQGGALVPVALLGDPAPGHPTPFTGFPSIFGHTPGMHQGRSTVAGTVNPGGGDLHGVWSERFGALEHVLSELDPLPGTPPGGVATSFDYGARGEVVFINARYAATATPPPDAEGLWSDASGMLELIAIRGMDAPGTPPGVTFGEGSILAFFGPIDEWDGNRLGQVVFNGYLSGAGIDEHNDEGLWFGPAGALALIAREGEPAPGQAPGTVWGASTGLECFGAAEHVQPVVNDAGSFLFGADLRGADFDHALSLWARRGGQLERIATAFSPLPGNPPGDPAPGLPLGFGFSDFLGGAINAGDEIAFAAIATHPSSGSRIGLWWDRPGALTLVAATGEPVPGLPGATFVELEAATFDDAGFLYHVARVEGPGVGPENDTLLLAVLPNGASCAVLREGDAFDLAGDGSDLRTVSVFQTGAGTTAGGGRVLEVFFTDGSTAVLAVEPGAGRAPAPFGVGGLRNLSLPPP